MERASGVLTLLPTDESVTLGGSLQMLSTWLQAYTVLLNTHDGNKHPSIHNRVHDNTAHDSLYNSQALEDGDYVTIKSPRLRILQLCLWRVLCPLRFCTEVLGLHPWFFPVIRSAGYQLLEDRCCLGNFSPSSGSHGEQKQYQVTEDSALLH